MTSVADVMDALERRFPLDLAEHWDVNGLTVGRPDADVTRALFAVDPTLAVVQEAIDAECDLIVTHHPLLLRGVSTVNAGTAKGAVIHALIEHGMALYNAHTNADHAGSGVAEALAEVLGVTGALPLVPLRDDAEQGTGRIGRLDAPITLRDFAARAAAVLPQTTHGVRVAGDLDGAVQTIAVVGGAGDSFLEAARVAGADVYLTSDLRHHPASDARETALLGDGRPYLVDVAHYASEWTWLEAAAEYLGDATGIDTIVSTLITDPWTARF